MVVFREMAKRRKIARPFREFCEQTTIHGFRYIATEEMGWVHSMMWLVVCSLGLVMLVVLMQRQWDRFQSYPTTLGVETLNYPISNVPFPAVSICNMNVVYRPAMEEFMKKLPSNRFSHNYTYYFFRSLPHLVSHHYSSHYYEDITDYIKTRFNLTIETLMYQLTQPCDKLLSKCKWVGMSLNCSQLFLLRKTSNGFCCLFNFHKNFEAFQRDRPMYVSGAGSFISLETSVHIEPENYVNDNVLIGSQVFIHDWRDYPEMSLSNIIFRQGQSISVAVTPSVIVSSDEVRNLALRQRQCYFNDEVKLNISPEYTYNSCFTQCRVKEIKNLCKCCPFYYPDCGNFSYCELKDVLCLRNYRHILYSFDTSDEESDEEAPGKTSDGKRLPRGLSCDCYPACIEHTYKATTDISESSTPHFGHLRKPPQEESTVWVYFESMTCLKYRRDAYMSWDSLLASFGGIFGLCLGGSIISVIELLYFIGKSIPKLYQKFFNKNLKKIDNCVCVQPVTQREKFLIPARYYPKDLNFERY